MKISFESAKGVSFFDVVQQEAFKNLSMFDLLSHENDEKVKSYLYEQGIDIGLRIDVQACVHRTLNNTRVIGYRYVGFERTDPEWLKDPRCTMAARLASQKDVSLAAEMKGMSTEGMSGAAYMAMCAKAKGTESALDDYVRVETEDTCEEDRALMKTLRSIQIEVRGSLTIDEDMFGAGVNK